MSAVMFIILVSILFNYCTGFVSNYATKISCNNTLSELSDYLENSVFHLDTDNFLIEYNTQKQYTNPKEILIISHCPPPRNPYADFLKENGINSSSFRLLIFDISFKMRTLLQAQHFQGLLIEELSLTDVTNITPQNIFYQNFTESLTNLEIFDVWGTMLPPMSESSTLKTINWIKGGSIGNFGGCGELQTVMLNSWEVVTDRWLADCTRIRFMLLGIMTHTAIIRILDGLNCLENLIIAYSDLSTFDVTKFLEKFLHNQLCLKSLEFRNIKLGFFPIIKGYLTHLEEILIVDNDLHNGYPFSELLMKAPKLRTLDLSDNPRLNLCINIGMFREKEVVMVSHIAHSQLENLILDNTNTTTIECIEPEGLPNLRILSLKGNNVKSFQELLISRLPLIVHLPERITFLNFTKIEYDEMHHGYNITLYGLEHLDCDCRHGNFARALREELLTAPNATCIDAEIGTDKISELTKISSDVYDCEKFQCESCTCRRRTNGTVEAICESGDATRIPHVQGLSKLKAPYNRISTLLNEDIPESLIFLDLTGNNINYLDEDVADQIFSVKQRQLFLAENNIACECKNRKFVQAIQGNKNQVMDFKNLTCANNRSIFLHEIYPDTLCPLEKDISTTAGYTMIILSGVIMACVTVFSGFLYNRYKRTVCIYFHTKGICLCCIREDNIDTDKQYDAFVSFCHADDALVSQEFLPNLEERGYKVCIHYRDWSPGDLIPGQIVRSVALSRRTIIVLSRSFVSSAWGLMEFQTAHERALKENIIRVIVVVLDDVLETNELDVNLRHYLCSNTYIRYNDSWFWERLCYALPRSRIISAKNQNKTLSPHDVPLP